VRVRGDPASVRHEDFEAIAAENGSKGVQPAKAGLIDLVIMDVGLPDIDQQQPPATKSGTSRSNDRSYAIRRTTEQFVILTCVGLSS
jgi:DNA-binding NarL/FixJ family response regulator